MGININADYSGLNDALSRLTVEMLAEQRSSAGFVADAIFPEFARHPPPGATGYNVYVGSSPSDLRQLNPEPVRFKAESIPAIAADEIKAEGINSAAGAEAEILRELESVAVDLAANGQGDRWPNEVTPRDLEVAEMYCRLRDFRRFGYPLEEQMARLAELEETFRAREDWGAVERCWRLKVRQRQRFTRLITNAPIKSPSTRGTESILGEFFSLGGLGAFDEVARAWAEAKRQVEAQASAFVDGLYGAMRPLVNELMRMSADLGIRIPTPQEALIYGIEFQPPPRIESPRTVALDEARQKDWEFRNNTMPIKEYRKMIQQQPSAHVWNEAPPEREVFDMRRRL